MKTFREIQKRTHDDAKKMGWYDKPKSDVESLMMTVTELAECVEELRDGKPARYYQPLKIKPEGWAVEIADAIIRLMDLAEYKGVDLEPIIEEKLNYNLTRGHKHGGKKF